MRLRLMKCIQITRMRAKAVSEHVVRGSICLTTGQFIVKHGNCEGREATIIDTELKVPQSNESCQHQNKLTRSLGVSPMLFKPFSKLTGVIQKQGKGGTIKSKPIDVEQSLLIVHSCFKGERGMAFCSALQYWDEKWLVYDSKECNKSM